MSLDHELDAVVPFSGCGDMGADDAEASTELSCCAKLSELGCAASHARALKLSPRACACATEEGGDGCDTPGTSSMDAASTCGWQAHQKAQDIPEEEALAEPSSPVGGSIGSKEVPVSFEDLVQTVQAMGRLQKSMHEQLELLVAENARWRNKA
jgi:hypothetical protein